ncbi:MAG: hypothetical protein E7624_03100 [Ruminococcaceae bacterium]|nr:hypothetical protein [Oscillospiraceae bacterium]
MKKLCCIFGVLIVLFLVFVACEETQKPNTNDAAPDTEQTPGEGQQEEGTEDLTKPTEGVVYEKSKDGTYATVKGYNGEAKHVVIANTYQGSPVKEIGVEAFKHADITTVVIPSSVTDIRTRAFYMCTALENAVFEKGFLGHIDENVFYSCTKLAKTEYDACSYIASVDNPYFLLYECTAKSMDAYEIHKDTKIIAGGAFAKCKKVKTITIPASVNLICESAFSECELLSEVVFEADSQLKMIGNYAFYQCASFATIAFPEGLCRIGEWAFFETALTSVLIPASVTEVLPGLFANCAMLERITVADGNAKYHAEGNCLIETQSRTLIAGCKTSVIPADGSVTSIADSAFYECVALREITIPACVNWIGEYAFANCTSLASAVFINTADWVAVYGKEERDIPAEGLSNPEKAAEFLTDDYCVEIWKCTRIPQEMN